MSNSLDSAEDVVALAQYLFYLFFVNSHAKTSITEYIPTPGRKATFSNRGGAFQALRIQPEAPG